MTFPFKDTRRTREQAQADSSACSYKMAQQALADLPPEMVAQLIESSVARLEGLPPQRIHDVGNYISQHADRFDT